ncbi:MAG: 3'-5' exonuclease [Burkholderiaceae bacterium]
MSAPSRISMDWPQYMGRMAATTRRPALARFYQAHWPEADTPLEDVEFVALDVETTGLDARRHAIVSVGLIPMTLTRIRSNQAWHQLVRPAGGLIPESVAFHHITDTDISRAPPFADILEPLLERLAGKVALVHYHPIERAFIDQAVHRAFGEGLQFPMVDTMQIEAGLYRGRQPNWLLRLLGRKPISIRLADSRTRYGLPLYQAHHALTDALATAELFQAQVATHFSGRDRLGALWL